LRLPSTAISEDCAILTMQKKKRSERVKLPAQTRVTYSMCSELYRREPCITDAIVNQVIFWTSSRHGLLRTDTMMLL
jgi:hypothetical protein